MKSYYVYMMTNKYNKVLYIGVTNNLIRNKLVWFEESGNIESAILKEKRMKKWKREYKENVINEMNPAWRDLYDDLLAE